MAINLIKSNTKKGGEYILICVCCVCNTAYDSKQTTECENHLKVSHGFCKDCLVTYCQENNLDPNTITKKESEAKNDYISPTKKH